MQLVRLRQHIHADLILSVCTGPGVVFVMCITITSPTMMPVQVYHNIYANLTLSVCTGVAVVFVMCITTLMASLTMLLVWRPHPLLPLLFWLVLTFVEGIFLTSVLYKVRMHNSCCTICALMVSDLHKAHARQHALTAVSTTHNSNCIAAVLAGDRFCNRDLLHLSPQQGWGYTQAVIGSQLSLSAVLQKLRLRPDSHGMCTATSQPELIVAYMQWALQQKCLH